MGQAAIGFTTYSLCNGNEPGWSRWKLLLGILILSNLPDVDVALGIVFLGNGNALHRSSTHSLISAFPGGLCAYGVCRVWSRLPGLSFRTCFSLILLHLVADTLLTSSPISLFWPMAVSWTTGHSGLGEVLKLVLFGNDQDGKILIGCASLVLLQRALMARRKPGGLRKPRSVLREGDAPLKRGNCPDR
jgi:hypothetical protein